MYIGGATGWDAPALSELIGALRRGAWSVRRPATASCEEKKNNWQGLKLISSLPVRMARIKSSFTGLTAWVLVLVLYPSLASVFSNGILPESRLVLTTTLLVHAKLTHRLARSMPQFRIYILSI
jgi:hypothetical protein